MFKKTYSRWQGKVSLLNFSNYRGETKFIARPQEQSQGKVVGIVVDGHFVSHMEKGQTGLVILDQTPFYAEMGGQVGDHGSLKNAEQQFLVNDTLAPYKGLIGHQGVLEKGTLRLGESLDAQIDLVRRQKIANNHTATHLLHWALHKGSRRTHQTSRFRRRSPKIALRF